MRALRARLSGLATPTYMLDIPGGWGKAPIGPQWIHVGENGEHMVTDPQGVSARLCGSTWREERAVNGHRPTNCSNAGSLPSEMLFATLLAAMR